MSQLKKLSIAFLLAYALDQISKYLVVSMLPVYNSINLGLLRITYVTNTGISFGMLKGNNPLLILVSVVALAIFIHLSWKNQRYWMQFSLICAGILGNLTDRIFRGYVVDFIDFRIWPVFNLADSYVSIGIVWLLVLLFVRKDELA